LNSVERGKTLERHFTNQLLYQLSYSSTPGEL
jgi:hypothetical protein